MIGVIRNNTNQLSAPQGWVCPLCNAALAPWMPSCPYHQVQTETSDKAIWPKRPRGYEVDPREADGYKYATEIEEPELTPDEWRRYMEKEPPWERGHYDCDTGKKVWRMG